jgi:hypothetical protein
MCAVSLVSTKESAPRKGVITAAAVAAKPRRPRDKDAQSSIIIHTAATTCSDFPNQAAAQHDPKTRAADGDGIYCEIALCLSQAVLCTRPNLHILAPTFRCRRQPDPRRDRHCALGAAFPGMTARRVCTPGYASRVRNVSAHH